MCTHTELEPMSVLQRVTCCARLPVALTACMGAQASSVEVGPAGVTPGSCIAFLPHLSEIHRSSHVLHLFNASQAPVHATSAATNKSSGHTQCSRGTQTCQGTISSSWASNTLTCNAAAFAFFVQRLQAVSGDWSGARYAPDLLATRRPFEH